MNLKNYTSTALVSTTVARIEQLLAKAGGQHDQQGVRAGQRAGGVAVQISLIQMEQAGVVEVFLPYALRLDREANVLPSTQGRRVQAATGAL